MMQMIAELKMLLLEILESAFQNGDVHATQQMGVNMSNAVKREGVVIARIRMLKCSLVSCRRW